jgi:hypothetical protein
MKPEDSSSLTQLIPHVQDFVNNIWRLLEYSCQYSIVETNRSIVSQDQRSDDTPSENAADTTTRTHVTK